LPAQLAGARFVRSAPGAQASCLLFSVASVFDLARCKFAAFATSLGKRRQALPSRTIKKLIGICALTLLVLISSPYAFGKKRIPPGGRVAVVVDERLSALRAAPDLTAKLLERLSRGHLVSIRGEKTTADGLKFYRVALSRRTFGWLQSDAVVVPWRAGDDRRLLTLIENSDEFDRIVRAKTFLDAFPQSLLRSKVLAMYAGEAEDVADKLTRDAGRRFTKNELPPIGAPEFSYYLNYNGLDRYNREGITFLFDRTTKKFSYDGAAWREILKRYPNSPEAGEAKEHLESLAKMKTK
jgi:hypothetical protein